MECPPSIEKSAAILRIVPPPAVNHITLSMLLGLFPIACCSTTHSETCRNRAFHALTQLVLLARFRNLTNQAMRREVAEPGFAGTSSFRVLRVGGICAGLL